MKHLTTRRIAAGILTVALAALGLAGCGAQPHADPVVVVVSATANEPAPALGTEDVAVLGKAADADDGAVTLITPAGTSSMPLTPRRDNGQVEHGPRRAELRDANLRAVQDKIAGEGASGPYDLLELLGTASRVGGAPGTLVLVSSGLSTSGGLDMRQVLWGADPARVAQELKARGLVPTLVGWTVVFTGLGDTMPPQQPLATPQRTALAAYWTAVCKATGAKACTVNAEPRAAKPPVSTTPVPTVPVPQIHSVVGPGDVTTTTLPADALFAFDSAALDPSAQQTLQPLATAARTRHLRVEITGYASPDGGTAAYNRALSKARADNIRTMMIRLGVPADQFDSVTGVGVDEYPPGACTTDGRLDQAKCAQLRRVVVVTRPSPRSPA